MTHECLGHFSLFQAKEKQKIVGSTTDKFRFRWDNYKENNRKAESNIYSHFIENFTSNDHNGFLEDDSITFIEKKQMDLSALEETNAGKDF